MSKEKGKKEDKFQEWCWFYDIKCVRLFLDHINEKKKSSEITVLFLHPRNKYEWWGRECKRSAIPHHKMFLR